MIRIHPYMIMCQESHSIRMSELGADEAGTLGFHCGVHHTVEIVTHLRDRYSLAHSMVLLWLPKSCFVLGIADFPRDIRMLVHQQLL